MMRARHPASGLIAACLVLSWPAIALAQPIGESQAAEEVILILVLLAAAVIYVIPSIVAFSRRHPNRWPILVINIVFGGTGLGWLGSLVWAMGAVHKSATGSDGGESGLNIFVNDPKTVRIENPEQLSRAAAEDPGERLLRLKKLYDDGALDAAEYAALRRPLLDVLSGRP